MNDRMKKKTGTVIFIEIFKSKYKNIKYKISKAKHYIRLLCKKYVLI